MFDILENVYLNTRAIFRIMNVNQSKIVELLGSLPELLEITLVPATTEELNNFIDTARSREVPENVILQLVDLYGVANGYDYNVIMSVPT